MQRIIDKIDQLKSGGREAASLIYAGARANSALDLQPAREAQKEPKVIVSDGKRRLAVVDALINRIDIIGSDTEEACLINRLVRTEETIVVSFVNHHVVNLAWSSSDFAACLMESDILLRDGIGLELCLAFLRRGAGRNMNGTDFIPKLAAAFAGRRTVVFGTVEPWITKAGSVLAVSGCRIVGKMDGFRPVSDYVAEVMRTEPELVILAMGNPKQEAVAKVIAASIINPTVIVSGGAIADFLGQRFGRAPLWLRRARCEWLFRMLHEPKRLWRRYLFGGVSFARCVLLLRLVCPRVLSLRS